VIGDKGILLMKEQNKNINNIFRKDNKE